MREDPLTDLPVYILQPALAEIRCEPRRMPLGPNRAPGRAVTPYQRVNCLFRVPSS